MNLEDLYRLLRSSHVQAQGIIDTLEEPLLVLDQARCVINGNRAFFEKFSLDRDDTIGRSLFTLGTHQWDVAELRQLLQDVIPKAAAIIGFEVTAEFPTGRRTMLVSARRLFHPDNNSTSILMIFEDVTERRREDAEKDILLGETRHRMKNLLAVVRVLATQTEVEGRSAEEFRNAFLGRLDAVQRAEKISLDGNAGADLGVLIGQALEPIAPDRRRIEPGPPVSLKREQIVPMSLILNELATNAFKYGALSSAQGCVHLTWRVATEAGRSALHLHWKEENGPPVTAPANGSGFGTRLIQFSATQTLGGSAELSFERGGLQVRVTAPLQ
jgi:PAS domain S-box-containing protein